MTTTVRDHPRENRYEIYDGDQLAGFTDYELSHSTISFTHTEVFPDFNGRGLARQLVAAELDDVRARGLSVLPFCPYVRKIIAASPGQYLDLVPAGERERFELPSDGDDSGLGEAAQGQS